MWFKKAAAAKTVDSFSKAHDTPEKFLFLNTLQTDWIT
jgi:hypothetical protein